MAELIVWEGKDIEKMSREDLLEAFRRLADMYREEINKYECVCIRPK